MVLGAIATVLLATADGGDGDRVRLQAAVVVASNQGGDVQKMLQPLEQRLKTLLPYTAYQGFTEYTASLSVGEPLELRLPDGRFIHLTPKSATAHTGNPIHVAVDRGETFDSRVACDATTVFQIKNGTADHAGERLFLVFRETCPGDHPARVLP